VGAGGEAGGLEELDELAALEELEGALGLLVEALRGEGGAEVDVGGEVGRLEADDLAQVAQVGGRHRPGQQVDLAQALAAPRGHVWLFSSSEAVGHLRALAPHANWTHSQAMATHARIAQAAGVIGFAQVAVVEPSLQAVAAWEAQGAQGGGPLESSAS
jgi:uroporphyrinogen-III synthase